MNLTDWTLAETLSRLHLVQPWLLNAGRSEVQMAERRRALRQAGVPVLECNDVPALEIAAWVEAATEFSAEFMTPVALCAANLSELADWENSPTYIEQHGQVVNDADWLHTRQVALTRAVEISPLNQEFRRNRERKGWIRIGWQPEVALVEGNGLLLAWSSPLPLRRIRDFAARCPEITLIGPDAEALAAEVAAQGISILGWRFAVK